MEALARSASFEAALLGVISYGDSELTVVSRFPDRWYLHKSLLCHNLSHGLSDPCELARRRERRKGWHEQRWREQIVRRAGNG